MKEAKKEQAPQADLLAPYYEMAKLPRTGKFDRYVYPFKPEYHDDPNFLSPRAGFRGCKEMEESRLYYQYGIVQGVPGRSIAYASRRRGISILYRCGYYTFL